MDNWRRLKFEMDMKYNLEMLKYEAHEKLMKETRESFYKDNPDFPIKTMFLNVIAPPQRVLIEIIE